MTSILIAKKRHTIFLLEASKSLPTISSYSDAVELVRDAFWEATKYHMVADVELGVFLSDGVDSAAVVADMQLTSGKG